MKRRGFIGSLFGVLLAPTILPVLSLPVESSGIIYAPYIPIIKYGCIQDMLTANMIKDIQDEIDNEIMNNIFTPMNKKLYVMVR